MHSYRSALLLLSLGCAAVADFVGPTYPAPRDLSSGNSLVRKAWDDLSSTFDAYFKHNRTTKETVSLEGLEQVTFSTGLFSLLDPAAAHVQYHYSSPKTAKSPNGTNLVDGDSIYGIASVTKLFTVFTGLLELTDAQWNTPLSKIIPGLTNTTGNSHDKLIYNSPWDKITPWSLANQISGVAHQGLPALDLLFYGPEVLGTNSVTMYGFPPLSLSVLGPCLTKTGYCNDQQYIQSIRSQPPVFLPWTTPAYANNGFILLGIAISKLLNRPITDVYKKAVFQPLGLSSTFAGNPKDPADVVRSVIFSTFDVPSKLPIPSGGLYSTPNDLAKFGTAILNSTLLPADQTRKWMKPFSHTASLTYSVGAPWEIARYLHPDTGKITDIYTKSGDSGSYGGYLALIPEYNAGFTLLDGSDNTTLKSSAQNIIMDYITNAVLPALEAQAAVEAAHNFAGTYVSEDSGLNSSLVVSFNQSTAPSAPANALSISRWISNGTDVLTSDQFAGFKPRLLPSIPINSAEGVDSRQVAFQATVNPVLHAYFARGAEKLGVLGPFTGQAATAYDWQVVDAATYANFGVDLFVFDVDAEGEASCVLPAAARARLRRK